MSDNEIDNNKTPLIEHLAELRKRLLICCVGIILAFFGFYFVSADIYNFLVHPLALATEGQAGRRMIFTGLHEAFLTQVKVAFFAAIFFSFPFLSMQIWRFIAPGLYLKEKRAFLPFILATPLFFILGASFVYYMVIPLAWDFFLSFEQPSGHGVLPMQLEPKVDEYLSLIMRLIMAFGICFELPVLIVLLTKVGLTNSKSLKNKRKYAILIAFVVAAVITPPDVISQILLAVPIIVLYEVSIWCSKIIEED
jgi:sec-independent protein translocase protein TatC